jgi:GNAT superfamily N-acetyltransferase
LNKDSYVLKELTGFDDGERREAESFIAECFFDLGWEYSEYDKADDGRIFDGVSGGKAGFWRLFEGGTLVGTVAIREIADRADEPKETEKTKSGDTENACKTVGAEEIKSRGKEKIYGFDGIKNGKICELKRFYVKKDRQGKGLGRLLIKTALDCAKTAGYGIIRADTEYKCKSSIHLMEAFGFSRVSRYNDNPFAELFYELNLETV